MKIKLGLIGYPLGHSFSPAYFQKKFEREGINGCYELYPLERIEMLPDLLEREPDLSGLNVTIPYKQEVMPYLDSIDINAREIGAVNTIRIRHGQKGMNDRPYVLEGFNTDWIGFRDSIINLIEPDAEALILGAGGAARGVSHALKVMNIPHLIVSRHPEMNTNMSARVISYGDLTEEIMLSHKIIINTTPLGMYPNTDASPDIPWEFVGGGSLCYDLIYNPAVTRFMINAANCGATVKNGLNMLHGQAEAAWKIWTGRL